MKRCPTCDRLYNDAINFCPTDGAPLQHDASAAKSEAETQRMQPEMSAQDIIMEIADHLRKTVSQGEQALIRFEPLTGLNLTMAQISEHFEAAAQRADCEVIDKTETRATVRRESGIYIA